MDAWILRLDNYRPLMGSGSRVVVLHVTPDGHETELEVQELDLSNTLFFCAENQISQGHLRLVLDLDSVRKMDPILLGSIFPTSERTKKLGGEIVVVAKLDSKVRGALELTNAVKAFPVFDSIPAALRQFDSLTTTR